MKILLTAFVVAVGLLASAVTAPAQNNAPGGGITELHRKGFNLMVSALDVSDYATKIETGAYTLIAPTDVAFRDMPKAQLDALLADKEKLNALLAQHIVEGKVSSADLKAGVKTLAGTTIKAKSVDGKLKIGAATVVRMDIPTAQGVIHGVDKFLQP